MTRRFQLLLAPRLRANRWDVLAGALVLATIALFMQAGVQMRAPMTGLEIAPIVLDPRALPGYALRTTVRMFVAMVFTLLFTMVVGTLAARSRRAGLILLPLLDVLQSVPVLGYLSFTVVLFFTLFPGSLMGPELAAIFAIFTSQVWNMTFSFYQSLRTIPADLADAARSLRLSPWQRFWHLDLPFATPGLVWNAMVSISGGWFFVVACEAISVGDRTIELPGIGSYVAMAITQRNLAAIGWALLAMLVVIGLTDLLLFRPLVAWSDQFRLGDTRATAAPRSAMLTLWRRTRLLRRIAGALKRALGRYTLGKPMTPWRGPASHTGSRRLADLLFYASLLALATGSIWFAQHFLRAFPASEWLRVFGLGALTLLRVLVVTALAMLVWIPVGVAIGLNPAWTARVQPVVQFLAAIPVNLLFPIAVYAIVHLRLNHDVWLSPLVVLGAQWYILFNVIAGASTIPHELLEIARNLQVKGWLRWRDVLLPGIAPYAITGALTAWGGAWNATIVAEVVLWGDQRLVAHGLGAYIATSTEAGDFARIALGVATMCLYVVVINRLVWRPLYDAVERRFRFD